MTMQEYTIQLLKKKQLASNIYELRFTKPDGFDFEAGQFVQCVVLDGDKMTTRSYSLAGTPADEDILFCVKMLPDGVASAFFKEMKVGKRMTIRGPLGRFVCSDEASAHVFVATGVGLAPIMGIIEDELKNKKTDKETRLLFGVRSEDDVFWLERLDALQTAFPTFSYTCTLSRPNGVWKGISGRVTDHLDDHDTTHDFYICGSPEMVMDVRKRLTERGVPAKQIHFEIF